jgi:DNA-binding transcriptional MerR regulator
LTGLRGGSQLVFVQATFTIGDFSRITHLSVKTLRFYHRVGLLEPIEVDPVSSYRHYGRSQIGTAHAIRRFRELGLPVEAVKAVLNAPDLESRDDLLGAHLDRLTDQLAHTQAAVSSLRGLLERPTPAPAIELRAVAACPALAISAHVTRLDLLTWWADTQQELRDVARAAGLIQTAPMAGLYADELFTEEHGDATLFLPVADPPATLGPASALVVPAAELAVVVHHGSHDNADLTYGLLGAYASEHSVDALPAGPVREYYLVGVTDTKNTDNWQTEICWPL